MAFEVLVNCLGGLGILTIIYFAFQIAQFAYLYLRPSSLAGYRHGLDSWALITGASDGIGLGFAKELGKQGFNLILLGHKPDELKVAASSIQRNSPSVQIRILVIDAVSSPLQMLEDALATVKSLHITVLINNVGGLPPMSSSEYETLAAYTAEEVDGTININARFMAQITRNLLPSLILNGPALIMNIGSGAQMGLAYQVMYSGTKGFIASFSAALAAEAVAESWPIEVMAIVPGQVRSGANKVPLSWATPSAEVFAKASLDRVGCGLSVVPGYWRHALQIALLESFPISMKKHELIKMMKYLRENNLKKK